MSETVTDKDLDEIWERISGYWSEMSRAEWSLWHSELQTLDPRLATAALLEIWRTQERRIRPTWKTFRAAYQREFDRQRRQDGEQDDYPDDRWRGPFSEFCDRVRSGVVTLRDPDALATLARFIDKPDKALAEIPPPTPAGLHLGADDDVPF